MNVIKTIKKICEDKKIRKAVRTYLIKDDKIVVIKYKQHDNGYYDIPGGKIEDNETSQEASIREFKEETGIDILKQHFIGKCFIEFPNRLFDLDVYIVDEYIGEPLEFAENYSMWIDLEKIQNESKIFASIKAIKYLKDNMNLKIYCKSNDTILEINEN